MRLEYIPVVMGVLVLIISAGILFDAAKPEEIRPFSERRRRRRAELDVPGEWLVGLGTSCLGVSLIGNEIWRWTTVAVISGVVLIVLGAILNREYLKEMLLFRGAARRASKGESLPAGPTPRLRIR